MSLPAVEYRPRHPKDSDYYHCGEDYFETLRHVNEDNFSRDYEFWRPYIEKVIYRYLDCGDLNHDFAKVKGKSCDYAASKTHKLHFHDQPESIILFTPLHLVPKIFLTHKSAPFILRPTKSNFL